MKIHNIMYPAGILIFSGLLIFAGIFTGEYLFKGYSVCNNVVSDLGQRVEPINSSKASSLIFNSAMIIGGLAIFISGFLFHSKIDNYFVSIPLMIHGIATMGVGIFPSTVKPVHIIFAIVTFISIEFASIAAYWITSGFSKYLLATLGVISIFFLLGNFIFKSLIGEGAAERLIIYPTTLWLILFGFYVILHKQ